MCEFFIQQMFLFHQNLIGSFSQTSVCKHVCDLVKYLLHQNLNLDKLEAKLNYCFSSETTKQMVPHLSSAKAQAHHSSSQYTCPLTTHQPPQINLLFQDFLVSRRRKPQHRSLLPSSLLQRCHPHLVFPFALLVFLFSLTFQVHFFFVF